MDIKVVPYNFTETLEEMSTNNTTCVGIDSMSITYIQPADTCSSADEIQEITISSQCGEAADADTDSFYYNISIPSGQHWSVSDGEELKQLVEDFSKRLHMIKEQNNNE